MNESREQIWKEVIIDHGQFPRRHGRVESASHQGQGENPFCGDKVSLYLRISSDGLISDIGFEGTGCAISLSSASLLTTNIVGKSSQDARDLFDSVHHLLTGTGAQGEQNMGELEALSLVRRYPARVKCATLVWHVLRNVLEGEQATATTE